MSLNQIVLIGRLVRDPEDLKYTKNTGVAVTNFTLAVDRPFKNQDGEKEADFIKVVVWRKQAENVVEYLKKGSQAAVVGRLEIKDYTDKDGNKRKSTEVVANNVQFLGGKNDKNSGSNDKNEDLTKSEGWEGKEIKDDDVPF